MRSASSATALKVSRRLWVYRGEAVSPFVWGGLLPLLGLLLLAGYALGDFARQGIEARVREGVQAALHSQGHDWVAARVSGQEVFLTGDAPRAGDGEQALALARAATCDTWSGPRTCAVHVAGAFSSPPAAPAPAPAAATRAAARACEAEFTRLLAGARIQFRPGEADIDPASNGLLDELAQAARACPGVVRIEGHTDSSGDAGANEALSLARATAVRGALVRRGLDAARLLAEGFGAQRPIADNATAAGRLVNRRIEFRADADAGAAQP
ncbi:MAG: OmpA family protein [Steroidobacteraceae bacterium]